MNCLSLNVAVMEINVNSLAYNAGFENNEIIGKARLLYPCSKSAK